MSGTRRASPLTPAIASQQPSVSGAKQSSISRAATEREIFKLPAFSMTILSFTAAIPHPNAHSSASQPLWKNASSDLIAAAQSRRVSGISRAASQTSARASCRAEESTRLMSSPRSRTCSEGHCGRPRCGLGELLLCERCTRRRQSVEMPRRTARLLGRLPFGMEKPAIAEPDQDRIERAGFETGFLRELITVAPRPRLVEERCEQGECLVGTLAFGFHSVIKLYICRLVAVERAFANRDVAHAARRWAQALG